MSVDPYSLCPCGSGKKLKFCCTDLVGDIEKVHRMIEGDQPRAALAHVTQTLAKSPERGSLLDMKAMLELSLGDLDAAAATIEKFLQVDPQNPASYAQAALLAAAYERARDAADALQRSLELLADEMPTRVLQAIGAVGQAMLIEGSLVAARAHLWLYQGITGSGDSRAMELLMRLNQSAELPLLLRDHLYLRELPLGHSAETQHDLVQVLASRGQWQRALQQLDPLVAEHPDQPVLHYNQGLLNGWLGDTEKLVAGLRTFSGLAYPVPATREDAVEAEAICQLIDPSVDDQSAEIVRTDFTIQDEEALTDRLTRDPRTVPHELNTSELSGIEGPPPRQTCLLLDRPLPESGMDLSTDQIPRVLGFISHFGRQTDRPERLELIAERGPGPLEGEQAIALQTVTDLGGEALGESVEPVVVGRAPANEPCLSIRWHFPFDTPVTDRRALISGERRRALLEEWSTKPQPNLSGKTADEAAQDSDQALPLEASMLLLQQRAVNVDEDVFTTLRERLGIPQPEPIDLSTTELDLLPLVRIGRADLTQASDEELRSLYERATLAGAEQEMLAVARVAIDRPSTAELLPHEDLFYRLVSLERDPHDARAWVDRARKEADEAGKSNATWDILELELRVVNGELEEANLLVQHLRENHLQEPGVAEQLYQLLTALGAVPPGGAAPDASAPASAPAVESKLWTPGDDTPSPASKGDQKIWTPS